MEDIEEVGCKDIDRNHPAQDRVSCEHGNELSGSMKGGEFLN
jgi:hypothetical protein